MDPGPGPSPGPGPDLTIVLLGNSGVGKSASGNTILGRREFESKLSLRSVTTQISEATGTVFGKQISVMDTPGILGSEREVQTRCQDLLQSSRPCLFLVVVKIDRFTIEQKTAVEAALRVVGDQGFNSCYLLFTSGDMLADRSLDDLISEDPDSPLTPLIQRFAERRHLFNNENRGPEQVRELLKKSGHLTDDVLADRSLDDLISDDPDGPLTPLVQRFAGRSHLFNTETGGPEQVRELLKKSGHLTDVGRPRSDRRMVLIGLPEGGKSASGNTILGSDQFKSAGSFNSVTTETVSKSAVVEGRDVTVVDTPGITNEVLTPKRLYEELMKSIVKASPGPHAFIIVVRIGRITKADVKLFELLPKLFGSDACRYSMVLFTHGDRLKDQSIEDLIQSNSPVSELVSMCGDRYRVFDNSQRGNRVQVRNLLDQIDEMVTADGGEYCTSIPSQTLTARFLRWFKEFLKEIVQMMRSCYDFLFSTDARYPAATMVRY